MPRNEPRKTRAAKAAGRSQDKPPARMRRQPSKSRQPAAEATRIGRRGTYVIPATLRRRFGLDEGSYVLAEERPEGILLRPADIYPVEIYTPERKAEFLLNNAVDADDYRGMVKEVRRMGLDPDKINHIKPKGA